MRETIFGNIGTLIAFQLGHPDARKLADEFYPVFSADDLIGLPNYSICLRLMIDGTISSLWDGSTRVVGMGRPLQSYWPDSAFQLSFEEVKMWPGFLGFGKKVTVALSSLSATIDR